MRYCCCVVVSVAFAVIVVVDLVFVIVDVVFVYKIHPIYKKTKTPPYSNNTHVLIRVLIHLDLN